MIELNEKLVLANKQVIECVAFNMDKVNGKWVGSIRFIVKDENGKAVNSKIVNVSKDDWNVFWNDFSTGTKLYEKLGLGNVVDSEKDFVNGGNL